MKKSLLFIVCSWHFITWCQQDYWQQQVNYTIDVSLNDEEHALDGFIKIEYFNNSPDTLHFIWFHVWPNAYKNDKTAFSDQMLENGRTDFYFSDKEQKGYINRLDFRVDGLIASVEDHPEYIDIIKIILPKPLTPGNKIQITTPFHEKLPFNFSRGGHEGQSYQITQWYPKPAVYDQKGWHPMPYLDQGEFYSEYGSFDVRITLPANYVVAATGELQNEEEKKWLGERVSGKWKMESGEMPGKIQKSKISNSNQKKPQTTNHKQQTNIIPSATQTKTLQYKQNNIHDFAWFADKRFTVNHDTLQLASGRVIDVYSFYTSVENKAWQKSIQYIKDAVHFRSAVIGEYPYSIINVVEAKMGFPGGMEYPTITSISSIKEEKGLEMTIEHEVGHNWFYGVLGSNERRYPWMDEGINTYYDKRYEDWKYNGSGKWKMENGKESKNPRSRSAKSVLQNKRPVNRDQLYIDILAKEKLDQPISTPSEEFNEMNYSLIAYAKTAQWMKQLEDSLGTAVFDNYMQEYFRQWKFKHPYPQDFRSIIEKTSGRHLEEQFALLDKKGSLTPVVKHKKIKPAFLFNLNNTDSISYLNIIPGIGYNLYDKLMIGAVINNFNSPPYNFQFLLAPLYATNSKQLNGIGAVGYSLYPDNRFQKIEIMLDAYRFSTLSGTDSNGNKIFGGFYKITPSVRFTFRNKTARSTMDNWLEFKTFIIGEKGFDKYVFKLSDSNYYPIVGKYNTRYINQITFNIEDYRVLYPYKLQLQLQQGSQFYRVNLTGNYFFNYSNSGGMGVRFFAAKFGYIGNKASDLDVFIYQPKLTATRGDEDYTYGNYFIGRNEFTGFASQQIMMKDGGLKLRTDLFQGLQGRSNNWIAAMNFSSTLPPGLFPFKLPLKIFVDAGTYAEAWQNNSPTGKFLYVGGLQLSLFKNILNIYAPIFYSSEFRDKLKSVPEENTFGKRLSFSIDIQNFNPKKIFRNTPF